MVSNSKYIRDNISSTNFEGIEKLKNFRVVNYPGVIKNMYYISDRGKVYSIVNDSFISWKTCNGFPYVNLSITNKDGSHTLESIYIKDLVAYSFIEDSMSYLERGYHSSNVDGNPMNCGIDNIVYIK